MKPKISVVLIAYKMRREIVRTVASFSPPYQQGLHPDDVEILVVDNEAQPALAESDFAGLAANVRVVRPPQALPSPCQAINYGVSCAAAEYVAVGIDGARIASPGVLALGLQAQGLGEEVFAVTLGFHLGSEAQQFSAAKGYDQQVEDTLLRQIDWTNNGYGLFDISCLGRSYQRGALSRAPETTLFVTRRSLFQAIGGFNEDFISPGGGIANFDLFDRMLARPQTAYVLLLGEGTFHQYHGGVTTKAGGLTQEVDDGLTMKDAFWAEYKSVTGRDYDFPTRLPLFFGTIPSPKMRRIFFPE